MSIVALVNRQRSIDQADPPCGVGAGDLKHDRFGNAHGLSRLRKLERACQAATLDAVDRCEIVGVVGFCHRQPACRTSVGIRQSIREQIDADTQVIDPLRQVVGWDIPCSREPPQTFGEFFVLHAAEFVAATEHQCPDVPEVCFPAKFDVLRFQTPGPVDVLLAVAAVTQEDRCRTVQHLACGGSFAGGQRVVDGVAPFAVARAPVGGAFQYLAFPLRS